MKKIISLLIITVMMMLSLASCNNSDGRTKITEEEWNALDKITNYTCNISGVDYEFAFGTYHSRNYTDTIKITENAKEHSSIYGGDPETITYHCLSESGEVYRLSKSSDGTWQAKTSKWTHRSLLEYITYSTVKFDDLTYSIKDKCYTASITDEYGTITFTYHFKNGSLIKYEERSSDPDDKYKETVTFSNIGTTTVTLPEYTFKD